MVMVVRVAEIEMKDSKNESGRFSSCVQACTASFPILKLVAQADAKPVKDPVWVIAPAKVSQDMLLFLSE